MFGIELVVFVKLLVKFEWTKITGTKYPLVSSFIRIGCVCYIFGLLVLFVGLLLH